MKLDQAVDWEIDTALPALPLRRASFLGLAALVRGFGVELLGPCRWERFALVADLADSDESFNRPGVGVSADAEDAPLVRNRGVEVLGALPFVLAKDFL